MKKEAEKCAMFGDTFYPSSPAVIGKMIKKVHKSANKILDPSAGMGALIEGYMERYSRYNMPDISAIEIDKDLRSVLRGKGIKVIDTDFLAFSGPDKFDLIIANPPFRDGDKHLLKAIEIMYRGQIVFLLNAETIRNPCTNTRKELVRKLEELGAEVEYIHDAFADAERPACVDVALIDIRINRNVEEDLFAGADDVAAGCTETIRGANELATGKGVYELVAEYNQVVSICMETIVSYFRNYRKVCSYVAINREAEKCNYMKGDLTDEMQGIVNKMLTSVRRDFWRKTLDLREVGSRMTKKKIAEFEHAINERCNMDFTENNIRAFVLNVISGYEKTITDAVIDIFDMFTARHAYGEMGVYEKNIHYFNGWKTNKVFKVCRRVVIPVYGSFGGAFRSWGAWKLDYRAAEKLRDIDVVMNYFDGMSSYVSINKALEDAFARGESSKIRSTYFTITAHKKGTIHLTFNDDDILRRFNVAACSGKGWLPGDYGRTEYAKLLPEEKTVIDEFEGRESYDENRVKPVFPQSVKVLKIAA
jgi:hypothetical protein